MHCHYSGTSFQTSYAQGESLISDVGFLIADLIQIYDSKLVTDNQLLPTNNR